MTSGVETAASPGFLRRNRVKLLVILFFGTILVSFTSYRPTCGLPGYDAGPELRAEYLEAFLGEMYRLREREDYSWSGIFLTRGLRLYLLPWEKNTRLTKKANRLAVRYLFDRWQGDLPERVRLAALYRLDQGAAIAAGAPGSQILARRWCSKFEEATRPKGW